MKPLSEASITDAEFNAVRALAAQGRSIPNIVLAAMLRRLEDTERTDAEMPAAS